MEWIPLAGSAQFEQDLKVAFIYTPGYIAAEPLEKFHGSGRARFFLLF